MITTKQFSTLEDLYNFYNKELFDGKLNDCLINMSHDKKAHGVFRPERWKNSDEKKDIHEISLNPESLDRDDKEWHATFVHEMCHLWQADFGKPSRGNYHNKEWANKMELVGLIPSSTGKEGGKKTGQAMTHYIDPAGRFIKAYNLLKDKNIYKPVSGWGGLIKKPTADRSKTKYICSSCNATVWGKPDLSIQCVSCEKLFIQENKEPK